MKTKEELNALKNEVKVLNQKLYTLTEEELTQVTGGAVPRVIPKPVFDGFPGYKKGELIIPLE